VIRTRRLLLRGFQNTDLAAFSAVLSDPITMSVWGGPYGDERAERELAGYLEHAARHGFAPFAVMFRGQLIGDIGLQHLEGGPDVELLYRLLPSAWGRGLATEAGDAALMHAFSTLERSEVVAVIAESNGRSLRLADRLGFTRGAIGTYYGQSLVRHRVSPDLHARAARRRANWSVDTESLPEPTG
jgi:[ribosomal protein S5]-alanine N-acetyltransferase